MRNLISNLFNKKEVVDIEKLKLAADLSIQNAKADPYLIGLAVDQHKLDFLQPYFASVKDIDTTKRIFLSEEIENLQILVNAYQSLLGKNFYIKIQNNIPTDSNFKSEPFILFPSVQNAIHYGYNSMDKYPIRIKINNIGTKTKLEVSNRMNHHIQSQTSTALISNFKSRLSLIYPDNHELLINSNSTLFKVTLVIG